MAETWSKMSQIGSLFLGSMHLPFSNGTSGRFSGRYWGHFSGTKILLNCYPVPLERGGGVPEHRAAVQKHAAQGRQTPSRQDARCGTRVILCSVQYNVLHNYTPPAKSVERCCCIVGNKSIFHRIRRRASILDNSSQSLLAVLGHLS